MKQWNDLTIRDNFIFSKTMEMNLDLCKKLLEEILRIKIDEIQILEREKTIENRIDSKGIRLDVYVADSKRVYDIEMQVSDTRDLPLRMRYYQGLIDQDWLKRGEHYCELRESFIIFICDFDLYRNGFYVYTFHERCEENPEILLEDRTTKIVLNARRKRGQISDELRRFLKYVSTGQIEGEFVPKLDQVVRELKEDQKARLEFMTYQMEMKENERRGREEGFRDAIELLAKKMLKKKKPLSEIQELTELPIERIKELSKLI